MTTDPTPTPGSLKVIGPYVPVAGYGKAVAIIVNEIGDGVCTLYGRDVIRMGPMAESVRQLLESHLDALPVIKTRD